MQIGKYTLDDEQEKAATSKYKNTLVTAGAGSGKTLTILGRIKYLLEKENIKENEVLCISFTRQSSISLKEKIRKELNKDIDVYTFHKLGLQILGSKYEITDDNTLMFIIDEVFKEITKKKNNIVYKYLSVENMCEYLKKEKEINNLKNLIHRFIKLFKSNDYKLYKFIEMKKQIKRISNIYYYRKEKIFLVLALNTYLNYQSYLKENNEIDFDDMLSLSKEHVNNSTFINNYKHIIIDEFQDTSTIRLNLIKEIIKKTNASLYVVGDDYQSIYRFTGCDLNVFLNFTNLFEDSAILNITNTYRNSNDLIKIASQFIERNPKQLKKNLKSNKHLNNPIEIIYIKDNKKDFKRLIENVYNHHLNNILVLGRNNNDIYSYIDEDFIVNNSKVIYKKNKDINITYLTVHK